MISRWQVAVKFDRAETLGANHRLALVYRQWQKMPPEQQSALRAHAQQVRQQLGTL